MKAGRAGEDRAQFNVGLCYLEGRGAEENHDQSFFWINEAMESENIEAAMLMGAAYSTGKGIKKDNKATIDCTLICLKAEGRAPLAGGIYRTIAAMYDEGGFGIDQDYRKALEYYNKSANANFESGATDVGIFYLKGNKCVKQDFRKAFE